MLVRNVTFQPAGISIHCV